MYTEGNIAFPYWAVGNNSSNVAKLLFKESIPPCTASNKPASPEVKLQSLKFLYKILRPVNILRISFLILPISNNTTPDKKPDIVSISFSKSLIKTVNAERVSAWVLVEALVWEITGDPPPPTAKGTAKRFKTFFINL